MTHFDYNQFFVYQVLLRQNAVNLLHSLIMQLGHYQMHACYA
jgi:hypothetical protein